jgi:hypothetical protein
MKDVKSTANFVQALNESLESGALMCQLYNAELNKYVMNLTNDFCRKQVENGVPRNYYIKKAAECLGRQPDSKIWVLNSEIQVNDYGDLITSDESPFIWIGGMVGNRNFATIAPPEDAATIPALNTPEKVFNETLGLLKKAVGNNYLSSFFFIASAAMALHYEEVIEKYGMCPTPVSVGLKNTGKSTAARTAISLLGTPQFFLRDFSLTQTSILTSRRTFPTVLDDPSDLTKVKNLIDNTFNAGARSTTRATMRSRTTALVTLNWDKMKTLCSNYK